MSRTFKQTKPEAKPVKNIKLNKKANRPAKAFKHYQLNDFDDLQTLLTLPTSIVRRLV